MLPTEWGGAYPIRAILWASRVIQWCYHRKAGISVAHIIQFDFSHSWVSAVLNGLRTAAHEIEQRYRTEEGFDALVRLEHQEEILGVSCVAVQSYMNRTWAEIQKYDLKVNRTEAKLQMYQMFGPKIGQPGIAHAELVYHLANYWKHHDEWPDWTPKQNEPRYGTVKVLANVGITADTDFPCIHGLQKIRPPVDPLFDELEQLLFDWRRAAVSYHLSESNGGAET